MPHATWTAARGCGTGRRARPDRRLAGGRPRGEGTGRAGTGRRCVCRGRPGARRAVARDPARRDRSRSGASARVADAHGGAEALAFDVACLSGPEAALPHGAPVTSGARWHGPAVRSPGAGRRVSQRHDPDAVRGRACLRATAIYELVARAQAASIAPWRPSVAGEGKLPSESRAGTAMARQVIDGRPGHGEHSATARDTGIGLATHEAPRWQDGLGDAICQPDRLLGRAGCLSRWRDGGPHRGPCRIDRRREARRTVDQFPREVVFGYA